MTAFYTFSNFGSMLIADWLFALNAAFPGLPSFANRLLGANVAWSNNNFPASVVSWLVISSKLDCHWFIEVASDRQFGWLVSHDLLI